MLGLRRDVSFLLEKGHSQSRLYPLIMLWNEVAICRERKRADMVAQTIILQQVLAATSPNHTSKTVKAATKSLEELLKDIEHGKFG